jgi:hypothetical protein
MFLTTSHYIQQTKTNKNRPTIFVFCFEANSNSVVVSFVVSLELGKKMNFGHEVWWGGVGRERKRAREKGNGKTK